MTLPIARALRGTATVLAMILPMAASANCLSAPNDLNPLEYHELSTVDDAIGTIFGTRTFSLNITCSPDPTGAAQPREIRLDTLHPTIPGTDLIGTVLPGAGVRLSRDDRVLSGPPQIPLFTHPGDGSTVSMTLKADLVKAFNVTPGLLNSDVFVLVSRTPHSETVQTIGLKRIVGTTFHGVACSVVESSRNLHIDLGGVDRSHFEGVGSTLNTRDFAINLKCTPYGDGHGSPLSIELTGNATPDHPDVLALQSGSAAATGVGIQLLTRGTPLSLNSLNRIGMVDGSFVSLPLTARYYQTAPRVTPGEVNATLTFVVQMR